MCFFLLRKSNHRRSEVPFADCQLAHTQQQQEVVLHSTTMQAPRTNNPPPLVVTQQPTTSYYPTPTSNALAPAPTPQQLPPAAESNDFIPMSTVLFRLAIKVSEFSFLNIPSRTMYEREVGRSSSEATSQEQKQNAVASLITFYQEQGVPRMLGSTALAFGSDLLYGIISSVSYGTLSDFLLHKCCLNLSKFNAITFQCFARWCPSCFAERLLSK